MTNAPYEISISDLSAVTGGAGGVNTVTGTDGRDTIITGDTEDHIYGRGGADVLSAGGGNDFISGEDGRDTLDGGAGNDDLSGGGGADLIHGGDGEDNVRGGGGDDTIHGGVGDNASDWARGNDGNDTYIWSPGSGNDRFDGGKGLNTVVVQGVSMAEVLQALHLDFHHAGYEISVIGPGEIVFTREGLDGSERVFPCSGYITIGEERLSFNEVSRLRIVP